MSALFAATAGALAGAAIVSLLLEAAAAVAPGRARRAGRARRPRGIPLRLLAAASGAGGRLAAAIRLTPPRSAGAEARLAAAGLDGYLSARDWGGLKVALAVVAGVFGVAGAGSLPGRLSVVAVLVAPAAGFVVPDFWLARRVEQRLRAAGRELAPMLDLLQVTVEAGAAPAAALGAVGARFTGPLAAEWRAAAMAVTLGTPQDEALATLTTRLPAPRIRAFTDCMTRARRRGVPLGDLLAQQAAAARHEDQLRVREQAARAGPKIQLVVALVMVPSVMLIVAAALIAEITAPGMSLSY